MQPVDDRRETARGWLGRLRRDRRANTVAIMTAAIVPMIGMVGGGVDVSRMYILKTRLQHACDAGALAGRKAMGAGTWAFNNNHARGEAERFFDANIANGSYGSTNMVRTFTEAAGRVSGNAHARIPMTLMRVFGQGEREIAVTCSSEMRLPNTDVMFVLDTTGSMAWPQPGDSVNRMDALKTSVKCFYEIVARLDTNATCTTGTPSGGTGDQVQIRFGFVPYSSNVNVGRLLPTSFMADSWQYQTRRAMFSDHASTNGPTETAREYRNRDPRNDWQTVSSTRMTSGECANQSVPGDTAFTSSGRENTAPEGHDTGPGTNPRTTMRVTYQYGSYYSYDRQYDGSRCLIRRRTVFADLRRTYTTTVTTTRGFDGWNYDRLPVTVSLLKDGTNWRSSFEWPTGTQGANRTITWDGCIEERETVRTTNFSPIPAAAKDLDIDLVPSASDHSTLWAPALHQLIYARQVRTAWSQLNRDPVTTPDEYYNAVPYSCPTAARKLQSWPNATDFSAYVDSLRPSGGTYHDIGLLWGARLASPTGIFASENARSSRGGEIERHVIFMTDGDAETNNRTYTPYGMEWFDRRRTPDNAVPTGGSVSNAFTLTEQVNRRTEALCEAIRNRNFTLWVIAFGELSSETSTRLQGCATPGRYFVATNAATLQSTFKSIADQISMLRLTQ